ncbi:MAG: SUF system Fe-S cluster assembly regulator [Gammaproteobacteria bacterium]|nr:SUF system Fe-S cluster assembly regulator [Gammaproteobacteria bacterium]
MLRLSKLTDYGTVILACLAAQPDRLWTAAEVAERTRVAQPTVSKLLKMLQRSGLVSSTRGSHGGYQLARPAEQITAAEILEALEGPFAITECSSERGACGLESSCQVGHAWQRVNAAIYRALNDTSLAELSGIERKVSAATIPLTRLTRAPHD